MKQRFEQQICVTREAPEDWLVIGTPDHLALVAADDGQLVAVYQLVEVFTFHKNATLEPLGTAKRRKRKRV